MRCLTRYALVLAAVTLAACGSGPAASTATVGPSAAVVTPPPSDPSLAPSPRPAETRPAPDGTWAGGLTDPSGTWPARLTLTGCGEVQAVCGSLEYENPSGAGLVSCASDLTYDGVEGDGHVFKETMVYQPWNCFPTTVRVRSPDAGSIIVEQVVEDGTVCCRGTFEALGADIRAADVPEPGTVPGIGKATSVAALGGGGTQYAATTDGSLWMPLENVGSVARIDTATGTMSGTTETGDPAATGDLKSDPHSVAAADGRVWVAQAAARSVAPLHATTGALGAPIALDAVPYALAIDGPTLWVTSFEDDLVIRVDLATSTVTARIPVPKPTGIAIGAKGVWVVRHRDDAVDRIDPTRNKVVATIKLVPPGPSAVCGRCVENVVVAYGSVWTADNEARVVSRIDPAKNAVAATITLPHRVWAVAAGGGSIWASQFESTVSGGFDPNALGIARIDPRTNAATTASYPVFSVTWAADVLWGLGPGRRGDLLYRIAIDP